jgi:pimeloyl-ACP methyl ester carboxylesterase
MDTQMASAATSLGIRAEQLARRAVHAATGYPAIRDSSGVHCHQGGDGPPLLLLNGWTASGLVWPAAIVKRFERRFRVLRVDARGVGWSRGAPAPFTIAELADDAAAVLRDSGHRRAIVAGLSMGGMVAQELAIRHPDAVDRLILLATRPPAPAHVASATPLWALATAPPPADRSLDDHIRQLWASFTGPGFAETHPELIDEIAAAVTRRVTPRAGLFNQARAVAAWHGAARLTRLRVPTVVMHGTADRLIPVGNGRRLAELIKASRYVELAGVGHLIPYEAPEQFAEIVEHNEKMEATK